MHDTANETNEFLKHAIWYARLGWHVFPVKPGAKRPLTPTGFHAATRDETQIAAWWTQWPDANIGVATDASGITVYDVDVGEGKQGATAHAQIADRLPLTLMARTRSGGLHYYFTAPPGAALRKTSIRPQGVTVVGETNLDLIAKGYVLAPPSIVEGGAYEWINADADLCGLPQFLIDAALAPSEPREQNTSPDGAILSGNRNNALYTLACRMRNAGMSQADLTAALFAINAERVSPPLPRDELLTIAQSATARAEFATDETDERLLAVVTGREPEPEALPEPEGPDDQSQVDAILDHLLLTNAAAKPTPPVVVYPTGFSELDKCLGGGFASRQLTTIMGGPAAGKSALAVSFARHLATASEAEPLPPPVLIVSTELEFSEIAARYAAPALRVAWRDIIRDADLYALVSDATKEAPVYVLDVTRLASQFEAGLQQIYDLAKRLEQRHGRTPIILIDYLQELAANVDVAEKTARTGQVANALRMISQRVPCAVLAISSVSRAGYGLSLQAIRDQNDPLAYLALAKESGQIEYASATVLFVDVEPDDAGHNRVGRLVVAKSRHGNTGFVGVEFDPALGVFGEKIGAGQSPVSGAKLKTKMFERAKVSEMVARSPGEFRMADAAKAAGVQTSVVAGMVADGLLVQRGKFLFVPVASTNPEPNDGN